MRLLLLVAHVASLALTVLCQSGNDANTANWVLQAIGGQPGTNPTGDSDGDTNAQTSKLDLTPTGMDTTVDCMTKDNKSGVCVIYYQCNTQTKTVIEDGAGLFDIRIRECPHYLEVCCKRNDVQYEGVKNEATGGDGSDMSNTANRNEEKGQDQSTTTSTTTTARPGGSKKTGIPECGWSNPGVSPFRFRDQDAGKKDPYSLYGDFPWMVAVMKKSNSGDVWSQGDYLGGGTLIHPSVVMTAAHKLSKKKKLYDASELKCRAGEWDTQTELELYPHQERDVMKYIIHEGYYRTSLYNDVALLFLTTPVQLKNAPHIGTACLATAAPAPGYNCYSMGWGKENSTDKKKFAQILKKVLLRSRDHDECQSLLRQSRLGPLFELHETLTCASGDPGVDTCRGDGGSPLVCPVSNDPSEARFTVLGMVAYGIKCFDPNVPGVYVNVPLLKSWVDAKMQSEGLDTKYYTL